MNRPNHLIRPAVAVAVVAAVLAPMARAGIDDGFGVRCALAMTQHRRDVAKICASDTSASRYMRAAAPTPNVTIVQPGTFDWGDAGVGAAGAVGLLSLGAGVLIISRVVPPHKVGQPDGGEPCMRRTACWAANTNEISSAMRRTGAAEQRCERSTM